METNQSLQISPSNPQSEAAVDPPSTAHGEQAPSLADWELMFVGGGEMLPAW
jgi:hypothetical protein